MTTKTKIAHHAQFSPEIITVIARLLEAYSIHRVHDPFAGKGVRLGQLCDELDIKFSGTEIEPSFIEDRRVRHGDARDRRRYPRKAPWAIVTSPVYPNGMADHHEAKDDSVRKTYRAAVKENEGADRELHEGNMARYGYRGTKRPDEGGRSVKRKSFWEIAEDSVRNWDGAELAIVNVSDFKAQGGVIEPFAKDWDAMMQRHGWRSINTGQVGTKRLTYGSDDSRDERMEHEWVFVYTRS